MLLPVRTFPLRLSVTRLKITSRHRTGSLRCAASRALPAAGLAPAASQPRFSDLLPRPAPDPLRPPELRPSARARQATLPTPGGPPWSWTAGPGGEGGAARGALARLSLRIVLHPERPPGSDEEAGAQRASVPVVQLMSEVPGQAPPSPAAFPLPPHLPLPPRPSRFGPMVPLQHPCVTRDSPTSDRGCHP